MILRCRIAAAATASNLFNHPSIVRSRASAASRTVNVADATIITGANWSAIRCTGKWSATAGGSGVKLTQITLGTTASNIRQPRSSR